MDESSKINFENLLRNARSRLDELKEFYGVLLGRVESEGGQPELRQWITDVFADKIYATNAELKMVLAQVPNARSTEISHYCDQVVESLIVLAHSDFNPSDIRLLHMPRISEYIHQLIKSTESQFVYARKYMYEQGWTGLSTIKPIEPLDIQRKKYVNARDSLVKARECLNGKVEDVLLHLRTAIELSIKERFKFTKIFPMKGFFKDADKFDFPLPGYGLIYFLYDEGNSRMHAGKGITGFEGRQMIRIVSDFIDSLETITISDEKIDEFKSKSNSVE